MLAFDNSILAVDGSWLDVAPQPLPPIAANTVRLKLRQGASMPTNWGTAVLVDAENNIWDYTTDRWGALTDLDDIATDKTIFLEWIGNNFDSCYMFGYCMAWSNMTKANITLPSNTVALDYGFSSCTSLTDLTITGGGEIYSLTYAFNNCSSLRHMPNIDVSHITRCGYAFCHCVNIEDGILDVYNALAARESEITYHDSTFKDCGSNTVTGAAELAQIPSDWK